MNSHLQITINNNIRILRVNYILGPFGLHLSTYLVLFLKVSAKGPYGCKIYKLWSLSPLLSTCLRYIHVKFMKINEITLLFVYIILTFLEKRQFM